VSFLEPDMTIYADILKGMESLINQAFQHVEVIGEHVQHGHYDLVGPTGEIILPALWEAIIEPDWVITMHMWPMPEKKEEEPPPIMPPPDSFGEILDMDEILNGKKGKGKAKGTKHLNILSLPLRGTGYSSPTPSRRTELTHYGMLQLLLNGVGADLAGFPRGCWVGQPQNLSRL